MDRLLEVIGDSVGLGFENAQGIFSASDVVMDTGSGSETCVKSNSPIMIKPNGWCQSG